MEIKIIMFINLFAYCLVVSQSFSYIISLRNVQQNMNASAYIELRKLTDKNYQYKFRLILYFTLLSCTILTILSSMHLTGLLFITTFIAWIALVADVLIAVKGNMPINKTINSWTAETYPLDWQDYRNRWLSIFAKRQVLNIIGFLSLLAGAVFAS